MKGLDLYGKIALIALLVGGFDLLFVGLLDVNLILAIFGVLLGRLIFIVIGAAACYFCYLFYLGKKKPAV